MKRTLKYVGGLGLVAGFVSLPTIIFSFVGAFFCAGLLGLMLGTTKEAKRIAPWISVICPLVLLIVLLAEKSELAGRQVVIVVALCFGIFWVVYFGALALLACEKPATINPAADVATASPQVIARNNPQEDTRLPAPLLQLRLEELEGSWCCEICSNDGSAHKRILEIRGDVLQIHTLGSDGQVCGHCRGRLRLLPP